MQIKRTALSFHHLLYSLHLHHQLFSSCWLVFRSSFRRRGNWPSRRFTRRSRGQRPSCEISQSSLSAQIRSYQIFITSQPAACMNSPPSQLFWALAHRVCLGTRPVTLPDTPLVATAMVTASPTTHFTRHPTITKLSTSRQLRTCLRHNLLQLCRPRPLHRGLFLPHRPRQRKPSTSCP